MSVEYDLTEQLQRLSAVATAGFAIGLHVRFSTPSYMFQTYPKAWLDSYSREGLLMRDPAVAWGFANDGVVRWSDLADEDEAKVFSRAADHGLAHGVTYGLTRGGSKSIGGFARADRAFLPQEVEELKAAMIELHDETDSVAPLAEGVREELRRMSVAFTHP